MRMGNHGWGDDVGSDFEDNPKQETRWWRERRLKWLIEKYRGRCALCGVVCNRVPRDPRQATVDHIYPQSLGGSNARGNLQLACRVCNAMKADRLPLAV